MREYRRSGKKIKRGNKKQKKRNGKKPWGWDVWNRSNKMTRTASEEMGWSSETLDISVEGILSDQMTNYGPWPKGINQTW